MDALIAATERVQTGVGPPFLGTYRHAFMHDTTPRELPISKRKPAPLVHHAEGEIECLTLIWLGDLSSDG